MIQNTRRSSDDGDVQTIDHLKRRVRRLRLLLNRKCRLYQRRQRRRMHIALMHKVVLSCQKGSDIEQTLRCALEGVCDYTGWPVGHVYLPSRSDDLVPSSIWHLEDPSRYADFIEATEQQPLAPGEGLPGEVARTGRPAWRTDIEAGEDSDRTDTGRGEELEVHGAFAFPVIEEGEVTAVLEFFAPRPKPPDRLLLELTESISRELGLLLQRKRAEAAAARSAQKFEEMAQHACLGLVTIGDDDRVRFVNRAAEEAFGRSREQLIGLPGARLLPWSDRPAYERHMRRVHAGRKSPLLDRTVTIRLLRGDGDRFSADVSLVRLPGRDHHGESVMVMVQDIEAREADRRRFRAERRRLRRLLSALGTTEHSERRRLAEALHEHVAQLLATCQLRLSTLSGEPAPEQFQRTANVVSGILRDAISETRRIAAQLSPPELYDFGLIPAIRSWSSYLTAEYGVRVKIIGEKSPHDRSDAMVRTFLFQATRELLRNVAKHGQTEQVSVGHRQCRGWGVVMVRDRGSGFSPAAVDMQADGDERDGERDGEIGTGLATIRERAQYLDGCMRVRSRPGDGTRITLAVPLRVMASGPRDLTPV